MGVLYSISPERGTSALRGSYEEQFFQATLEKLPATSLSKLDSLVDSIAFLDEDKEDSRGDDGLLSFQELKADPGKPGVESVINTTIMLQSILSDRKWFDMMTPEDLRVLTPLIYAHVNPYGTFKLNMSERLPPGEGVIA